MSNRTKNNRRGQGEGIAFLRSHLYDADGPCIIWPMFRDPATGYGRMVCDTVIVATLLLSGHI